MPKAYKGKLFWENYITPLQEILYKQFVKLLHSSFLDYGDIIYHQPDKRTFCQKIESIQYKVALEITGAIRGISQTKLYKELRTESIKLRQ